VAGGIRILEPAVDLGIVFTIISSLLDRPIPHDLVCFGEVGLTGEIRSVGWMEERLGETAKLGFKRSIIPQHNLKADVDGLEVIGVSNIKEALDAAGLI
jgi:DNA repair protein RadA/Sms